MLVEEPGGRHSRAAGSSVLCTAVEEEGRHSSRHPHVGLEPVDTDDFALACGRIFTANGYHVYDGLDSICGPNQYWGSFGGLSDGTDKVYRILQLYSPPEILQETQ